MVYHVQFFIIDLHQAKVLDFFAIKRTIHLLVGFGATLCNFCSLFAFLSMGIINQVCINYSHLQL